MDPSQSVIRPRDPSVTSVGSESLSPGDIEKINCLYSCDGTSQGTCGGHISGDTGVLQSAGGLPFTSSGSGTKVCKWLLAATSGDAIELSFETFKVDCRSGAVMVYDGRDAADNRPQPPLLGTFCSPDQAAPLLTSSGRYLYIVYQSSDHHNSFRANWRSVTGKYLSLGASCYSILVTCCSSVTVSSANEEYSAYGDLLFGQSIE